MIQRIKTTLGKILNVGKHQSDDPRVQNCIVITNAILLFGIVLTVSISLELFRSFTPSLLLMNAGYVLVFCGMFAANHRGWHLFTRVLLMVISCGSIIVISRLYGHDMGHQNFAYAVLISSLVIFSSSEVRWIGFTAVLVISCYGYIEFFGRHWLGTTPLPAESLEVISFILKLSILITVIFPSGLLLYLNNLYFSNWQKEQQISLRTARLSALGEMAAGIAHEVNNPLSIIRGKAAQIIQLQSSGRLTAEKIEQTASTIVNTSERIAKIVRGLLDFSHDSSKFLPTAALVGHLIEATLNLCQAKLVAVGIQLQVNIDDCAGRHIVCNETQIIEIILNLLSNATFAASKVENKRVILTATADDSRVTFAVEDFGSGITEGLEERIMQPFFTTKAPGEGTGLGLSISQTLATRNKGVLRLVNRKHPTRFELVLPCAATKTSLLDKKVA